MIVQDMRVNSDFESNLALQRKRYEEIRDGAEFYAQEDVIPTRDDMAVVFSFLRKEYQLKHTYFPIRRLLGMLNNIQNFKIGFIKLEMIIRIMQELHLCEILKPVEDCFIFSFTGGGITCNDTGYSIRSAITASNCHIFNCGAGINVSCFSEYHKFTNIISTENLYGCINNGGNNVFVNCGFDCNGTGFLIDNSRKQSNNQAHGSAIGCTFNHSGNNSGIGIQILGANWGYVFEGGQVFYSKIVLENSTNISFTSFNFGGKKINEIDISGGNLTTFANCAFHFKPKFNVNDNDKVKISNCFTRDGEPVTL
jgi:hypothetical protein